MLLCKETLADFGIYPFSYASAIWCSSDFHHSILLCVRRDDNTSEWKSEPVFFLSLYINDDTALSLTFAARLSTGIKPIQRDGQELP